MTRTNHSYEIDMTTGALLPKIIRFALPLILANNLQILFNFADLAVVGRYAGSQALAAVGANTALIALLTNLFIGISTGADILISRHRGELNDGAVSRASHTAITTGFIIGIFLVFLGFIVSRPVLTMMNTPDDSRELAILYLRIYFLGMPAVMVYQFGAAILRAVGDTRRPLMILSSAGVLNVILNMIFVIRFDMSVAGVALATIISQAVCAVMILRCLIREESAYRIELKKLKVDTKELLHMLRTGLPIGLQSCLFAISNVLCQSSINTFGSLAMAGCAATASIENFCFMSMNAFIQTATSFTGQNYGARKHDRILKVYLNCLGLAMFIGLVMGQTIYHNGAFFISLFDKNPEVIPFGLLRMKLVSTFAFIVPIMDVTTASLRAIGHPLPPMISCLVSVCGLRVVHIYTIFKMFPRLDVLFAAYPVTWGLSGAVNVLLFIHYYRKLVRSYNEESQKAFY